MNIKLGQPHNYYSQRNDATAGLLSAYSAKSRNVACGPNAVLCGMEISGWMDPKYDKFWCKNIQRTDAYMMMLYNPVNEHILEKIRPNALKYPKQEVPQYLTLINHIYGEDIVHFSWGCNIGIIEEHLKVKQPVVVCGDFPGIGGHYVLVKGCTDNSFIYSDSYDIDRGIDYFNMKMSFEFFEKYIDKNFLLYIKGAPK